MMYTLYISKNHAWIVINHGLLEMMYTLYISKDHAWIVRDDV